MSTGNPTIQGSSMTPTTSRPISGSAVAGSAPADIVDIGDGHFAEIRDDGIAISHVRGGLHMAMCAEPAMVRTIQALRARVAELERDAAQVVGDLTRFANRHICEHEETYRGGAIWEICSSCGQKWADDKGGKPKFTEPVELVNAYRFLKNIAIKG